MMHKTTIGTPKGDVHITVKHSEGYVEVLGRLESGVLGFDIKHNVLSDANAVNVQINNHWSQSSVEEAREFIEKATATVDAAEKLQSIIKKHLDPEVAVLEILEQLDNDSISNAVLKLSLTPSVLATLEHNGNWNQGDASIDGNLIDAIVRCPSYQRVIDAVQTIKPEDWERPSKELPEQLQFMYSLFSKIPEKQNPIEEYRGSFKVVECMIELSLAIRNGKSITELYANY